MTEMEITYIFTSYISVTIRRQSKAFYRRIQKVSYHESKEFIESGELENKMLEFHTNSSDLFISNFEEKLLYQELLLKSLSSLTEMEKYIVCEKYLHQRSDVDIGKDFSVSGQMISRRKLEILRKLKKSFLSSI